jgi:hypothetical protein
MGEVLKSINTFTMMTYDLHYFMKPYFENEINSHYKWISTNYHFQSH